MKAQFAAQLIGLSVILLAAETASLLLAVIGMVVFWRNTFPKTKG